MTCTYKNIYYMILLRNHVYITYFQLEILGVFFTSRLSCILYAFELQIEQMLLHSRRNICHKLFTRVRRRWPLALIVSNVSRVRQKPSEFQATDFNRWRPLASSRAWLLISLYVHTSGAFLFSSRFLLGKTVALIPNKFDTSRKSHN